jgi:fibronectin-binding autotransporter adhesin
MVAIVTASNVGVPNGVAPLNSSSAVPVVNGGTGLAALPDGAIYATANAVSGGVLPVAYGGTGVTSATGTGPVVRADSPLLTGVSITGGTLDGMTMGSVMPVSINASSVVTQSLSVAGVTMTTTTGTGALVMADSPTLTNPNLGVPSAVTLTNATGLPLTTGTTGVLPVSKGGTGVATITGLLKGDGASAFTAAVSGVDYIGPDQIGTPNGVATLDATGKLTATQVPDFLLGALNYQGTWDADTNTPELTSGAGTKGWYYKVSVAGTTELDSITQWNLGDLAIFDGDAWSKVDGVTDQVLSVNGMTGTVVITRQLLGAASAGANADISSLTGLTTPLSVAQGGTGVTTETGTGAIVKAEDAVLVAPDLGIPVAVDLTNATNLPMETGVVGVLSIANGGTGESTRQAALTALAGAATTGQFLRGDGTNVTMSAIQASDIPTLNQDTTGSAAIVTGAAQPNITSVGTLTALNVEGPMSLVGSGSALYANGDSGVTGQVLTSSGPGSTPVWADVEGTGTVSSVDASGGSTGLVFTGGPITTSGTLTLAGTLSVAHGGTGTTTSTGTGSVVLSDSPVLSTPDLGVPSAIDLTNATNLDLSSAVIDVLPIANGGTGQSDALNARVALGAAASGANSDITSLAGLTTALSVGQGGTGVTTSTGTGSVVLSDAPSFSGTVIASAISMSGNLTLSGATAQITLNSSVGTAGQVLTSAGPGATPTWTTLTNTGTVSSVDASGGTTGLSFTGGPITTSGTLTLAGTLGASAGGTGITSYSVGDLVFASGATALSKLSDVATGNVLLSGGVNTAPLYGKVGLTTHVTGTLPVANGGTGVTTSTGTGSVVLSTSPTLNSPVISGGTINSTPIGGTTAAAGTFTTLSATTTLNLAGAAVPMQLNGSAGTAGQVLTSAGGTATPTWTSVGSVTSVEVSGGTTGLSFAGGPITTSGTFTMSGILAVASGGTGVTSSTGSGSNVLSASPTFTGTVNTANLNTTGTLSLVGSASPLSLNGSVGTSGQVLTSAGPGATPTWTSAGGLGTVTSVNVNGGTTGLTATGGPITTSGTITLGGVLTVANGGTGVTSSTGTGSVVLSASPTLTGTVNTANLTTTGALTLAGANSPLILTASPGTAGQVLTSAGPGATPYWDNTGGAGSVTSVNVSGGTTGLSFAGGPITTSGTFTMSGTLEVANGGTGVTSSTGTGSVVLSVSPTLTGTTSVGAITIATSASLAGASAPLLLNGAAGTAGQVLTSAGSGATPTWTTITGTGTVTSVDASGGTTGLSFSGGPVTESGTLTLTGTLAATNGGTGQSSYAVGDLLYASTTTALSKLAGVATGNVLISGGVNTAPSYGKVGLTTHVSGTLPVENGGTGVTTSTGTGSVVLSSSPILTTPDLGVPSAIDLTNATGLPLTTGVTGVLPVTRGGTGVTSSTGTGSVVLSASPTFTGTVGVSGSLALAGVTSPLLANSSAGTAGQVLTSGGPGATPTWTTISGAGTVTSVDASGGTTGLSFSGGPITNSGTLTLSGTLAVANGGTGVTTSTGTGSVVLSDSPTLTGTVNTDDLTVTGELSLSGASSPLLVGGSVGSVGQVLTSAGAGATPTWTNSVTTFSAGTTGLTPSSATSGAITLSGTLAVAHGGTGVTTSTGSGSNVLSTAPTLSGLQVGTDANYTLGSAGVQGTYPLTQDLTVITSAPPSSAVTLPPPSIGRTVVIANQTIRQIDVYPESGGTIDDLAVNAPLPLSSRRVMYYVGVSSTAWVSGSRLGVSASFMTGTLPVANGGTGVTTSTGTGSVVLSDSPSFTGTVAATGINTTGTLALVGVGAPITLGGNPGVSGQILTSLGPGSTPSWSTPTWGTVNSVQVSGGSTGLTFTGGPVTSTGTMTMSGALLAANGGTGISTYDVGDLLYASTTSALAKLTAAATGNVLLSGGVGTAPSYGKVGLTTHVSGTLPVANGGTGVTSSTGTGSVVLSTSPVLTTPNLGTPSAVTLTNATGLPLTTGVTGTLPVANGGTGVTTSTGTGSVVLSDSPTFTGAVSGDSVNLSSTSKATALYGSHSSLGGGTNLDLAAATSFSKTISGTTTFTLSNVPASGTFCCFVLDLTNGGSATVNLWSGIKWSGGVPTLTASGRDALIFYTFDGGTTWVGSHILDSK